MYVSYYSSLRFYLILLPAAKESISEYMYASGRRPATARRAQSGGTTDDDRPRLSKKDRKNELVCLRLTAAAEPDLAGSP